MEDSLDRPNHVFQQNRNLIVDILLEIQGIFKDCVDIESKYDTVLLANKSTEEQHVSSSQNTFDQRFPKRMDAFLRKTLSILERTPEVPKRLQWAFIKKDKFETMIGKLIAYNDSIEALLDSTAIDQLQQLQQHTYMALLQLNTSVKELREVSMALQMKASASSDQVQLQSPLVLGETTHGRVNVARLADFKAKQVQVETQFSEVSLDSIKPGNIHLLDGDWNKPRSEAKYQDQCLD